MTCSFSSLLIEQVIVGQCTAFFHIACARSTEFRIWMAAELLRYRSFFRVITDIRIFVPSAPSRCRVRRRPPYRTGFRKAWFRIKPGGVVQNRIFPHVQHPGAQSFFWSFPPGADGYPRPECRAYCRSKRSRIRAFSARRRAAIEQHRRARFNTRHQSRPAWRFRTVPPASLSGTDPRCSISVKPFDEV